jgi:hypothetical protein
MNLGDLYYYADAQNQAIGPLPLAELQNLRTSGTLQNSTLVVKEGGQDWVPFSSIQPASIAPSAKSPAPVTQIQEAHSLDSQGQYPAWAQQLLQKVDLLNQNLEKVTSLIEKSAAARLPTPPVPATASLHAERFKLNVAQKPGIAQTTQATGPRPTTATTLSPLAVPANATKSSLPLPPLASPSSDPQKSGNIFSKFLKK